jgi:uncharacterized protein with PQ loop repeat
MGSIPMLCSFKRAMFCWEISGIRALQTAADLLVAAAADVALVVVILMVLVAVGKFRARTPLVKADFVDVERNVAAIIKVKSFCLAKSILCGKDDRWR